MLYIIGIGLSDEKDITLKGLEAIKKSDLIYLETYTSKINTTIKKLEKLYGKKIITADRNLIENTDTILEKAKNKDVAFLVIGDALSATTHINLLLEAKKRGIKTEVIHNASIMTAIAITGLQLYNFGKTTSIPFENKNIKTPTEVIKNNQKLGMHTLILLDLDPINNKFMTINQAIDYLLKNKISGEKKALACCAIGTKEPVIKYAKLKELKKMKFKKFPQCLVIPGKLHFIEEEMLNLFA